MPTPRTSGGQGLPLACFDGPQDEVDDALATLAGQEDSHAAHVLAAAAFGQDLELEAVAGDEVDVDDGGRVVAGVLAGREGPFDDRLSEVAFRVALGDAPVYRLLEAAAGNVHLLAELDEDDGGAGVLAERDHLLSGESGVFQDLLQDLAAEGRLLVIAGALEGGDDVIG